MSYLSTEYAILGSTKLDEDVASMVGDPADTEDKGPYLIAVALGLSTTATFFVAARLYTRAVIKKLVYAEDYVIILSAVMLWAVTAMYIVAVQNGEGRHIWTLTQEEREAAARWFLFAPVPAVIGLGVPKIAVAMMLNRILFANYWMSLLSLFIAIMSTVNLVVAECLLLLQCSPMRPSWSENVPDALCLDERLVIGVCIYASIFSACADIFFAMWPAVIILKLETNIIKSIGLSSILGVGIFTSALGIYKASIMPLIASEDLTYDCVNLMIWTMTEAATILIASCVPMLTPIYIKIAQRFRWSKRRYGFHQGNSVAEYVHQLGNQRRLQHRHWDAESGLVHRGARRSWTLPRDGSNCADKVQISTGISFAVDASHNTSGLPEVAQGGGSDLASLSGAGND